jgi:hypothetical protein
MMTYAKQIAEAVREAILVNGLEGEDLDKVMDAIIASVPKPEPFGYFRCWPQSGWEDCAEDAEGAIALYEQPGSAEPVNARLLDALKVCANSGIDEWYPFTFEQGRNTAQEAITAAEQAKPMSEPAPVDTKLIDAVENYIRLRDELSGFDKHTHGGFATKETGLLLVSQAYEKMKVATEQAQTVPGEYYGIHLDDGLPALTPEKSAIEDQLIEKTKTLEHVSRQLIRAQIEIDNIRHLCDNRKVYICKHCEGVYADQPVSSCDCMGDPEWEVGYIVMAEKMELSRE